MRHKSEGKHSMTRIVEYVMNSVYPSTSLIKTQDMLPSPKRYLSAPLLDGRRRKNL